MLSCDEFLQIQEYVVNVILAEKDKGVKEGEHKKTPECCARSTMVRQNSRPLNVSNRRCKRPAYRQSGLRCHPGRSR